MEAHIKRQVATAGYIERFWENLLKVGKEKITKEYLLTRRGILESYWTKFMNTHDAIIVSDGYETSEYAKTDLYTQVEDAYAAVKTRINTAIGDARPAPPSSGGGDAATVLRHLQLPKLDLPKFDGDLLAWEGFRNLFRALVHDVDGLLPSQKLQYLRASLTGEAARVVTNVAISSDGYASAWDELITRYDNQRILLATHMRLLLSCPSVVKPSAPEINRLVGVVNLAARSFRALGRPVDHWDDWFVHVTVDKLDSATRLLWESSQSSSRDFPTYSELKDFLLTRARALDAASPSVSLPVDGSSRSKKSGRRDEVSSHATSTGAETKAPQCTLCRERHSLRNCLRFKAYTVENRRNQVRKHKVCFNCLGQGHLAGDCPSTNRCRHCQEKHHSLLHVTEVTPTATTTSKVASETKAPPEPAGGPEETSKIASLTSTTTSTVLLATAVVSLISDGGASITVRALLDSGSEASFVSERVVRQLQLSRRRTNVTVSGLQGISTGRAVHTVTILVGSPRSPTLRIALPRALVLQRLTTLTPGRPVQRGEWPHLSGLELADPHFDRPASVDAVLGADVFGLLMTGDIRRGSASEPSAHSSVFGWVLMGGTAESNPVLASTVTSHHATTIPDLQEDLRKFWELEEVSTEPILSPEEEQCERLFRETHRRTLEGRYVVRLPRRENPPTGLGASRRGALQILRATERRLDRDASLRQRYHEFMDAYHALGHMEPVPSSEGDNHHCYLPHHAVVKPSDPSGGVRVVFNASFRTESGASLNDVLLPGPKLQPDLWIVLSRWRLHRYAFATDIVKMFRQILVAPEDTDLQRILWRADPASAVRDFRLTTVTYGTAPAPYLAIRTLLQLAEDLGERYPRGAEVLRSDTYVDDILAGASTLEGARRVRDQTVELLAAAGFRLSKWAATHPELCDDEGAGERNISMADSVGALGLWWSPAADTLQLRVVPTTLPAVEPTKRIVLSQIARLFDPAGWTAPTLIVAKILIQDLWRAGVDWDQPLIPSLREQWMRYAATLPGLNLMRIPRWTGVKEGDHITLHGFSDASERAYAAAVYVRSEGPSDQPIARLLVAKTKVAPVKPTSIPRLELCGAVLLARLLRRTVDGLRLASGRIQAWTDARVVLAWIRSHPSRWKPFVANRVATIQELVPAEHWNYVPTRENPADVATRGLGPSELAACNEWWQGPSWLHGPSEHWPIQDGRILAVEEEERRVLTTAATMVPTENELLTRFSSLTRLVRVSSWCYRFLPEERSSRPPHLTTAELGECLMRWLRIVQGQDFAREIEALSRGRSIPTGSSLSALRPLLGPDGLLRIGGRLARSQLAYEERHPVILAKRSHLAVLLVRDAHHRTLHGGPQLVRSVLSRRYWIVHANSLIRRVIHQCVNCVRHRGAAAQQQMGQLPADRVRPGRPFESSGVDFAGPILLRTSKGRGQKTLKGYVCLFVCMATKAVHLEPVSDLTTDAFLAAFRRFVARRGRCSRLTSDNGTNFRGADRELQNMLRAASQFYRDGRILLAADGTDWSFIPPSAPHFGGLWEAGVRAVKHHLRRVLDGHHLTYEELATLLCQVEACLNSRPLYPLSADADDLEAITPGHFLIGEPPINVPEPSTLATPTHGIRLRWQLVTNLRDHIWGRWSREYLHHLQQLGRWRKLRENLRPGALVLVRSELSPPAKWPLGRVREVHPGADGLVRVVSVDTASGRLTRPIAKICVLPIQADGEPPLTDDGETATAD